MQALSSTQGSSNGSPDDSNEHNGNGISESSSCDAGTLTENTSSIGNHVENGIGSSLHINNNTIAINNNNCDTIKNNNQTVTVTAPLDISTLNDVEAVPAVALIEQQSALLRGVNIGMRVHQFEKMRFRTDNHRCVYIYCYFSRHIGPKKASVVYEKH